MIHIVHRCPVAHAHRPGRKAKSLRKLKIDFSGSIAWLSRFRYMFVDLDSRSRSGKISDEYWALRTSKSLPGAHHEVLTLERLQQGENGYLELCGDPGEDVKCRYFMMSLGSDFEVLKAHYSSLVTQSPAYEIWADALKWMDRWGESHAEEIEHIPIKHDWESPEGRRFVIHLPSQYELDRMKRISENQALMAELGL